MHGVQAELGSIEVICGPMFSGKSEELMRRLRRAELARQPLQVFKPQIDDRYDEHRIVSHSSIMMDAQVVKHAGDIAMFLRPDVKVVGIDECQFLDSELLELIERLAQRGVRVIAAGLDQDYMGRPFELMASLLAIAEYVTKTLAICTRCGAPAGRTQRLSGMGHRVLVGGADFYEARCRRCHDPRVEPLSGELFQ